MIRKIAIVPMVTNGRASEVGMDGHFNVFKKKRSKVLKEALESALNEKEYSAEIIVDVNHGDLRALKREGVDLFLIPHLVSIYVDRDGIDESACFRLTHEEYENGEVERIVQRIVG